MTLITEHVYPHWPSIAPAAREIMTAKLATARARLLAEGCTATSTPELDDEDRRLIREEGES